MRTMSEYAIRVKYICCCPPQAVHEQCGTLCKRHQRRTRSFFDRDTACPVLVIARIANYTCSTCHKTWTLQPENIGPRRKFTDAVRKLATSSFQEDGMPFVRIPRRLQRDFGLFVALSTVWTWWRDDDKTAFQTHQAQVIANFSGVLSVDEAFSGGHVLLLATDPLQNVTIGYEVTDSNDTEHITAFLKTLVEAGLVPKLVLTDEHKASPKALAAAFGDIRHGLCHFHFTKKLTKAVVKAAVAVVSAPQQMDEQTDCAPSDEPADACDEPGVTPDETETAAAAAAKELGEAKYLMVKRQEKLTQNQAQSLEMMTTYWPALVRLRTLMLAFYALFSGNPRPADARRRRDVFVNEYREIEDDKVRMYVEQLGDDAIFEKLVTPLYYQNAATTTNDTEQENRAFKKRMKHSYRLRTVESIECWQRQRMRSQKPKLNPLLSRFGPMAGNPALKQHRS